MRRGLAILVVIGAAALAHGSPAARVSLKRYVDPAGWQFTYPSSFHLERAASGGRDGLYEVTVASFRPRRGVQQRRLADGGWFFDLASPRAGRFPDDGVAVRIWSVADGPGWIDDGSDTRFPVRLASWTRSSDGTLDRSIVADGLRYTATVTIGRHAAPRLRAALARTIESLRFPAERAGTTVGHDYVLQTAAQYRPGSFTLVHARGEPVYLVHAPWPWQQLGRPPCAGVCVPTDDFYAVGWRIEYLLGGYSSRCALRPDRRRRQFYCANFDARWNRFGRTLRRPRWARADDDLAVIPAKVSWDGHVVLAQGG